MWFIVLLIQVSYEHEDIQLPTSIWHWSARKDHKSENGTHNFFSVSIYIFQSELECHHATVFSVHSFSKKLACTCKWYEYMKITALVTRQIYDSIFCRILNNYLCKTKFIGIESAQSNAMRWIFNYVQTFTSGDNKKNISTQKSYILHCTSQRPMKNVCQ